MSLQSLPLSTYLVWRWRRRLWFNAPSPPLPFPAKTCPESTPSRGVAGTARDRCGGPRSSCSYTCSFLRVNTRLSMFDNSMNDFLNRGAPPQNSAATSSRPAGACCPVAAAPRCLPGRPSPPSIRPSVRSACLRQVNGHEPIAAGTLLRASLSSYQPSGRAQSSST